jgi:hypothetical protein
MTIDTEEKEEEEEIVTVPGAVAAAAAAANTAAVGSNSSNAQRRNEDFPDAFYCPLTEKIMVDPVVDTKGESFERSAVTAKDKRDDVTGIIYYPNRALRTIIERDLERDENKGSLRGRVGESLRSGFDRFVKKQTRPLPDSFYCSITLDLMRMPVIDPDGRTFERDAIFNWIRENSTSPVTRSALAVSQLRSNKALRDLIEDEALDEKERTDESMHPDIRRWIMEDQTVETGIIRSVDPEGAPPDRVDGSNDGTTRTTAPGAEWNTGNNQNYPTTLAEWATWNNQNYPTTQTEIDQRHLWFRQPESGTCSRSIKLKVVIFLITFMLAMFLLGLLNGEADIY